MGSLEMQADQTKVHHRNYALKQTIFFNNVEHLIALFSGHKFENFQT